MTERSGNGPPVSGPHETNGAAERPAADRALAWCAGGAALAVTLAFLWLLGDLLRGGLARLDWDFLTRAPEEFGRAGGISTVLVSTLLVLAVAVAVAVPLGLATALLLADLPSASGRANGRAARGLLSLARGSLDLLAGVPSIVFGLFGNALFCVALGLGYSILSGGLTLACMILPLFVRAVELGLRRLPPELHLAGEALALSRWRLTFQVLLPAARGSIVAGLMLSIARALAETAALMFTSGYVARMPASLLDSGRTLSLHIHDLALNVSGGESTAYATALVLVVLLVGIQLVAATLVDRFVGVGSASTPDRAPLASLWR